MTEVSDAMATDYKKYILSTGTHYISNTGKDEHGGTENNYNQIADYVDARLAYVDGMIMV